jgi:hypothetical protein
MDGQGDLSLMNGSLLDRMDISPPPPKDSSPRNPATTRLHESPIQDGGGDTHGRHQQKSKPTSPLSPPPVNGIDADEYRRSKNDKIGTKEIIRNLDKFPDDIRPNCYEIIIELFEDPVGLSVKEFGNPNKKLIKEFKKKYRGTGGGRNALYILKNVILCLDGDYLLFGELGFDRATSYITYSMTTAIIRLYIAQNPSVITMINFMYLNNNSTKEQSESNSPSRTSMVKSTSKSPADNLFDKISSAMKNKPVQTSIRNQNKKGIDAETATHAANFYYNNSVRLSTDQSETSSSSSSSMATSMVEKKWLLSVTIEEAKQKWIIKARLPKIQGGLGENADYTVGIQWFRKQKPLNVQLKYGNGTGETKENTNVNSTAGIKTRIEQEEALSTPRVSITHPVYQRTLPRPDLFSPRAKPPTPTLNQNVYVYWYRPSEAHQIQWYRGKVVKLLPYDVVVEWIPGNGETTNVPRSAIEVSPTPPPEMNLEEEINYQLPGIMLAGGPGAGKQNICIGPAVNKSKWSPEEKKCYESLDEWKSLGLLDHHPTTDGGFLDPRFVQLVVLREKLSKGISKLDESERRHLLPYIVGDGNLPSPSPEDVKRYLELNGTRLWDSWPTFDGVAVLKVNDSKGRLQTVSDTKEWRHKQTGATASGNPDSTRYCSNPTGVCLQRPDATSGQTEAYLSSGLKIQAHTSKFDVTVNVDGLKGMEYTAGDGISANGPTMTHQDQVTIITRKMWIARFLWSFNSSDCSGGTTRLNVGDFWVDIWKPEKFVIASLQDMSSRHHSAVVKSPTRDNTMGFGPASSGTVTSTVVFDLNLESLWEQDLDFSFDVSPNSERYNDMLKRLRYATMNLDSQDFYKTLKSVVSKLGIPETNSTFSK